MKTENYVLVQWPESQMLTEQDWFDECIFVNENLDEVGPQAYLVPANRFETYDPTGSDLPIPEE